MTRMMPFRPLDGATRTERLVFNLFKHDGTLGGHVVLHSLGLARHHRKVYAECDFVVIGPKGVYCLEVKGGPIQRTDGVWRIGGAGGYTSAEGPFKQAQSARGALIAEVRQRCGTAMLKRMPFGWGVMFPSIMFTEVDPEWDLRCVFDERDLPNPISDYLTRLALYTRELESRHGRSYPQSVSPADIDAVVRTFRADFDLVPRMGSLVRESQAELISLTTEQYRTLDLVVHDANPRVLCEGAAGTGKTVVAAECSRRHADGGRTVLFLCFNRNLRVYFAEQEFASHARVTVDTIWNFIVNLMRRSGISTPSGEIPLDDIAQLVEDAVVILTDREQFEPYDVLIIDEAQDVIVPGLMNALDWIVKDGMTQGRWAVFLDSGSQASVYRRMDDRLLGRLRQLATNLPLSLNMRNPRAIAAEAARYVGLTPPDCRRTLSSRVDYRTIKGAGTMHSVARALITELLRDGVEAEQIALLSFRRPDEAFFAGGFESIGKPIRVMDVKSPKTMPGSLIASSIPAFKGLEADIVIVGDVPEPPLDNWARACMYVALTRAKTSVYIITSEKLVEHRLAFA